MRLAQIILPERDNDGESLEGVHAQLRKQLAEKFGGYTALKTVGGWIDQRSGKLFEEIGTTYQIGMADTGANSATLRHIAYNIGIMARQLAVAIVLPSGEFEIIEIA